MEDYEKERQSKKSYSEPEEFIDRDKYLRDLNSHLPHWVTNLVELYTSTMEHKVKYKKSK